jgi:hypothetical protein
MIQYKTIFDHRVVIAHCDNRQLWQSSELVEQLIDLLSQPEFTGLVPEQQGNARSTVTDTGQGQIAHIHDLQPLMQWIQQTVWEQRHYMGYSEAESLRLGRNWVNEMFRGCSGAVHRHGSHVCVFYLRLPENGADMQFVQDQDTVLAGAKEGDLLIHEPAIWHGVTEHQSDISRICLVIEFEFVI